MEIDHITSQKKCFFCKKVWHMAKHCQLKSINVVQSLTLSETTDVCSWQCGEKGHYWLVYIADMMQEVLFMLGKLYYKGVIYKSFPKSKWTLQYLRATVVDPLDTCWYCKMLL